MVAFSAGSRPGLALHPPPRPLVSSRPAEAPSPHWGPGRGQAPRPPRSPVEVQGSGAGAQQGLLVLSGDASPRDPGTAEARPLPPETPGQPEGHSAFLIQSRDQMPTGLRACQDPRGDRHGLRSQRPLPSPAARKWVQSRRPVVAPKPGRQEWPQDEAAQQSTAAGQWVWGHPGQR